MDDPLLMRRFERVRDLLGDGQCFFDRDGAARDALRQIVALDEFHHQRTDTAGFFQSVNDRDVGMVQRGQGLGFTQEAREPLGVVRERLGQDLDRDITIELGIPRPVDFAHAPAADRLDELEDAEARAGGEGQTVELYGRSDRAERITPDG